MAYAQGDYGRTVALQEESLTILRELDDQRGIAAALNNLGLVAQEQQDYARAAALHAESLEIERELGDQRGAVASLNNLGVVVAEQGDYVRAAALHWESLEILRDLGDKRNLVDSLEGLAAVAATSARPEPAARLLAAAIALREQLGVSVTPDEGARNDRVLASLRGRLGEPALAALLTSGRAMSVNDAVAEAWSVVQAVTSVPGSG